MSGEINAVDDDDANPMDYYEEYSEWLMSRSGLHICNGDDLIRHLESATFFDDFLDQRRP